LIIKSYVTESGERIDSARSTSSGTFILLSKISKSIQYLNNCLGENGNNESQTKLGINEIDELSISISHLAILKELDAVSSILISTLIKNTFHIHYVITDAQYIQNFFYLKNRKSSALFNNNHTVIKRGEEVFLMISEQESIASLLFPVLFVDKIKAMEMIRLTPEYLSSVHNRSSWSKKKSIAKRVHEESATTVRIKKKKKISTEEKIACYGRQVWPCYYLSFPFVYETSLATFSKRNFRIINKMLHPIST